MHDHLILALEAPMVSFGGETIDNYGLVRDFPTRSMLTGLIANALGIDRSEGERLDALQARIRHAAALVRPGRRERDYQTARLFEKDAGWTRRGVPEGRAGSPSFSWDERFEAERGLRRKSLTHQRYRDFDADARALVALHLAPAAGETLDAVAAALGQPERPLFIGRKPNLPCRPILTKLRPAAADPLTALAAGLQGEGVTARVQFDCEEGSPGDTISGEGFTVRIERVARIGDIRLNVSGVHAGTRPVAEGRLTLVGDDQNEAPPDPIGDWSAP